MDRDFFGCSACGGAGGAVVGAASGGAGGAAVGAPARADDPLAGPLGGLGGCVFHRYVFGFLSTFLNLPHNSSLGPGGLAGIGVGILGLLSG